MGWCTSAIVTFASACRGLCLCAVRGRLTVAKDGYDSIRGACTAPRVLKNIIFTALSARFYNLLCTNASGLKTYLTRSLKIADGIDMKQYVVNEIRCACTLHFRNEHHDLDTQCALLLVHRLKFFVAGLHVSPHRRRHTWRLAAVAFLYWNKEPSEICKCIARVRAT